MVWRPHMLELVLLAGLYLAAGVVVANSSMEMNGYRYSCKRFAEIVLLWLPFMLWWLFNHRGE